MQNGPRYRPKRQQRSNEPTTAPARGPQPTNTRGILSTLKNRTVLYGAQPTQEIQTIMNSNTIITFVVEGSGRFPIDMLRYDQAWPATVQAGIDITSTEPHDDQGNRVVQLHAKQQPTIGRWASFGWQVISVSPMATGKAREEVIKNAARATGCRGGAK